MIGPLLRSLRGQTRATRPQTLLFYSGARVARRGESYVVDPANWRRLKLLLEPFDAVDMLTVVTDAADRDWLPLPPSVRVTAAQPDFQPRGVASSLFKKLLFALHVPRIVGRFLRRARNAEAIGVVWLVEPVAVAGLLSALITQRPLYAVMIGSPRKSFTIKAATGGWLRRATYGGARSVALWAEKTIAARARLLLTTGERLAAELGAGVPFSTSLFSAKDIHPRIDTCDGPAIRWMYLGGISTQKGVDTLLRALAIARATDLRHRAVLIGFVDPAFPLNKLLDELGLAEAVDIIGRVSHDRAMEFLRTGDVFVFLSHHEGMPKAPLEAMAQGLPVVATPTGTEQYLVDGSNGVIVPVSDARAAATAVTRLVSNSDLRRRIIAGGLATAHSRTYEAGAAHVRYVLQEHFPALTSATKTDWELPQDNNPMSLDS